MEKLENIVFDIEDRNLFLIDDLRLKADAIRYSILPKMEIVMNYAINQIHKVYSVNIFDDGLISKAPNFRRKRENELKHNYNYAHLMLGGKREKGKWHGFKRIDDKETQIVNFGLGFELNQTGLLIFLTTNRFNVKSFDYKKTFEFLFRYDETISQIQKLTRTVDWYGINRKNWFIVDRKEMFKTMFEKEEFDYPMISDEIEYPITYEKLKLTIDRITLLYPILHSYLQIAKGEKIIFKKLIQKANDWLLEEVEEKVDTKRQEDNIIDLELAQLKAEVKIKVMPGIRWQVFQRDNWKCVACGRSAEDEIILHVDHITPRSKGGRDELDNYQTLCNICNIGKSNKDETDLRKAQ